MNEKTLKVRVISS